MTETLHVRWKPGTLDTLLVTSPHGTLEWNVLIFERVYGRAPLAALYLSGRTQVTRTAHPALSAATAA
ncbi:MULTISPECIES: hypothetical protein [Deinococcus]|uniref:Uncharacterized protein n=2 Tax=Deinococcus TaxID=1298 RepID=A0ABQ2JEE0_9DEIO|nr:MULTISPECIES: hypothetical protein [Deinococcus]ALW87959.1 hypothetical protein AUC44_02805 [Deinococcus actinosclerus]GGN45849.1 hypothetical protein GCM10010842_35810 [Deinococcus daejeonensis]